MSTKQIEVQILGKNFNFNIPANLKTENFHEIVDYVESKVRKIKREAGDLDSFRLGLLVAINITEEFFFLKQENEKLRAVLSNIDQMISPTDAAQDENEQVAIHFSS